ncbi:hypothetical protein [uncultured Parvibaculum sp.]|uniref:hypothetical protein n=1 Tax=uncultured Parvibaculum sp. TaxID=291828 RepID=UPI0030D99781
MKIVGESSTVVLELDEEKMLLFIHRLDSAGEKVLAGTLSLPDKSILEDVARFEALMLALGDNLSVDSPQVRKLLARWEK